MKDRNHAALRGIQKDMGGMGGCSCCASGKTVGVELLSCTQEVVRKMWCADQSGPAKAANLLPLLLEE